MIILWEHFSLGFKSMTIYTYEQKKVATQKMDNNILFVYKKNHFINKIIKIHYLVQTQEKIKKNGYM